MRRLTLALDGLPALRELTASREVDLPAVVTLAELAGVDAIRLGVSEELRPVREVDVAECRRAARRLELRMAPTPGLVKIALEGRPDRVVLSGQGSSGTAPLDLRARGVVLDPVVRTLAEAGIPCAAVVTPDLEAVKRVHGESIPAIEFYTGSIVDLPDSERRAELERLRALATLPDPEPLGRFDDPRAEALLAQAEILLTGWGCPPLDAGLLARAPCLRAVVHAAGTVKNHVTGACFERGLAISSAAAANAVPVAEYTLAAILFANKRAFQLSRRYCELRALR